MNPAPLPRNCPVCSRNEAQDCLRKGDLRLVRCRSCAMVYVNPVPAEFASGEYYDGAGAGYYLSPAKLESDYAEVRFERELRLFRQYCAGGAVLDVGCSTGAFLYQLRRRFPNDYDILGTDVSGPPLDHAESKGVPVFRGNFLTEAPAGRKFEAVTFWAVLEHLAQPRQFLERAWSLLESNGLCFVLVPNLGSLAMRLLGARYRYVYPQHLNYFTATTLKRLTAERFEVLTTRSTHFNPLVIWQDWRRGGQDVSNEERAALLKRTTAYKKSRWLKPVKTIYRLAERTLGAAQLADNVAMVMRKK